MMAPTTAIHPSIFQTAGAMWTIQLAKSVIDRNQKVSMMCLLLHSFMSLKLFVIFCPYDKFNVFKVGIKLSQVHVE